MSENKDVVKVTLRDNTYEIHPLSLDAVEKMWPLLDTAKKNNDDGIQMSLPETIDYACAVLSIAILDSCPESGMDKDKTKKTLNFRQIDMLQKKIAEILRQAGLSSGEPVPAEEETASPSTGTSEASTPSS